MTQPKYTSPRLGPTSISIIGSAGAVAIAGVVTSWPRLAPGFPQLMFATGLFYATVTAGSWLASAAPSRGIRVATRVGIVIGLAFIQGLLNQQPWIRNASNFAGVIVCQCFLMKLLQVPPWQIAFARRPAIESTTQACNRPFQFSIGDLVITTTAVAALLSVMIRYSPPIEATRYWLVLAQAWIILPFCLSAIALSLASWPATRRVIGWAMLATVLGAVGCGGLWAAEYLLVPDDSPEAAARLTRKAGGYLTIFLVCAGAFALVALAGRIQKPSRSV